MPLWQLAQLPAATPLWSIRAPEKLRVPWQLSQLWLVGMWVAGLTTLVFASRAPAVWQDSQSLGVPLNTPAWWQLSQRWF